MSSRHEVDNNNMVKINRIINSYPSIVNNYLNSIARKTSNTKLEYIRHICNFMDYVNSDLKLDIFNINIYDSIKPMHIDAYMEFIKYSKDGKENNGMYRASKLTAVKSFFQFLKINDIVRNNPCDNTEIPRDTTEHKITTISDSDMKIILSNIENGVGSNESITEQKKWKNRDKAIVMLGVTTGLRMSAILGIDINDIDFNNKTIKVVEKGDVIRTVYVGDNTINIITDWIKDRRELMGDTDIDALFVTRLKRRMSPRTMEYLIKRVTTGINKNLTPHKMRATCATKLYEKTGDIYLVQQQLGHKNIENTKRYAKVSEERRIQAANILDSLY